MKQFINAKKTTLLYFSIALMGAAGMQSCRKSSPDDAGGVGSAKVQLVNTSADAGSSKIILAQDVNNTNSVSAGSASGYINAFAGEQELTVQTASGTSLVKSTNQLDADTYYSFYLTGVNGSYSIFPVKDDVTPASGKAKVRFVQTATQLSSANLLMGGTALYAGLAFRSVSNYAEVTPGAYTFTLTNGNTLVNLASSSSITLQAGKNYSVFVSTQSVNNGNATLVLNVAANN